MNLLSLAQQHQASILHREAQMASQIAAQYKLAWSRILARLSWLFASINTAHQGGQQLSLSWLYEANRLQQALNQIHAEMSHFSQQANITVHASISQANQVGQQDAQQLLAKIGVRFGQPNPAAGASLASSLQSGPIAQRFAKMPADAVTRAKATLLSGLGLGWGPRQIARQLAADMSVQLSDALRIARTESLNAYRDAALQNYRANSDVVLGWQWLAEAGACPRCAALNGNVYDLSVDFNGAHPNCRCSSLPITKSYADILSA